MRNFLPYQLSATIRGGGSRRHRPCTATQVRSTMTRNQVSLSRRERPDPTGSGRRTGKSTGTTTVPSPITTTSSRPSIPSHTRCSWPLQPFPPTRKWGPYVLKRLSSLTQVHCHRLRVAGLLYSTCRHSRTNTSRSRRCRRLTHFRLGTAPKSRPGRFLSQPRPRHNSW